MCLLHFLFCLFESQAADCCRVPRTALTRPAEGQLAGLQLLIPAAQALQRVSPARLRVGVCPCLPDGCGKLLAVADPSSLNL